VQQLSLLIHSFTLCTVFDPIVNLGSQKRGTHALARRESTEDPSSTSTSIATLPSTVPSTNKSASQNSFRGTLILILNPPENHSELDLLYEIVIEVDATTVLAHI
jgi:hypothetical protein